MCKGQVVERGTTRRLLEHPEHSYTRKLLGAMPHRGPVRTFPQDATPIVAVRDLVVNYAGRRSFFGKSPQKNALKGISLEILPNQVVAVVGGSGSGKTTLGHAIAGLVKPTSGQIRFDGRPIEPGSVDYLNYRANCQMVFQDPYSSLDPRMTIEALIGEALRMIKEKSAAEKRARVVEVMGEVGLGEEYLTRYAHELSGGQRQRVAIARAVVRRPKFVIADEPVSALDVTVRAQVLSLFAELQAKHGFSCLFISHDLGVVEQIADRVVVMHEGAIVEEGRRDEIFDHPRHPYTRKLLSAIPTLRSAHDGGVKLAMRFDVEREATAVAH